MAHYPIKCVRCAHIATNNTVLFDVEDTTALLGDILSKQNNAYTVGGQVQNEQVETTPIIMDTKTSGIDWTNSEGDDATGDGDGVNRQEITVTKGRLMTYSAMKEYCVQNGLGEIKPFYQHVDVTPDFIGRDIDSPDADLLFGMSFRTEPNGAVRLARKRYCPVCHCELPARSGMMPTYNITVMGTSASGKTVYLCALSWLLSNGSGSLPYNSNMSCVPASRNGSTITDLSRQLFVEGVLPGTTQVLLTEPLVLQITYSLQGKSKNCLFALADMRGEDLVSDDGTNLLARSEFFARADGFMLLISPLNIPSISHRVSSDGGAETSTSVHTALMQNINDYIVPFMPSGKITAPSVVMLSKCDVLMANAEYLGIPRWNAVVAKDPPVRYSGTYFGNQYKGTRELVARDGSLHAYLNHTLNDPYYTSFSSLGAAVRINNDGPDGTRQVTNFNVLNPLRVVDPVLYLLIRLGFLPAFNLMEAGAAFEKKNVDILSEWIQTHT